MSTADLIPYDHEAGAPLTVGELRRLLADAPDEATVMAHVNDEPWHATSIGYLAQTAERLPATTSRRHPGPSVRLHCVPRSGRFMRPRPGRLVVTHGAPDDEQAAAELERLQRAVHLAVLDSGYRGPSDMSSTGSTTTWDWESANVAVAEVVAAAERAVARLDPGTWHVVRQVG